MDRIRSFFQKKEPEQEYAPLNEDSQFLENTRSHEQEHDVPFSWMEYGIFALLGVAMLWAWYGYDNLFSQPGMPFTDSLVLLGTCSSRPLRTFKGDFRQMSGCCKTSNRPLYPCLPSRT